MNARRPFLRTIVMVLLSLIVQSPLIGHLTAQTSSSDQSSFLLGTGSTGGTYHPVGVALSTLIKLKLLPTLNVDLTAINTSGSQENIDLMRQNEVQFAILSALSGHEAQQGIGRFSDFGANDNLRAITTLWSSIDHLIIHQDSVQSGTINDFVALRGQKMSLGRDDSGTLLENRALMAPLGIDIDTDFELVELDFTESAEALARGDIAGMSMSGGLPIRAVQDAFNALGDKAALLELTDEQIASIDQGRRIWARSVIPAGTYQGQDRDLFTIGTPNILAVRADVDDDVVYQITKTIFENLDYLHGLHGATREISLDTATSNLSLPLHEGALRYFEEKGVDLPAPPVEVDPNLLARFDSTNQAREQLNQGIISLFTGADGDTSARIATDLASTLNVADDGVRLLPTYGGGSGQNLTDLLYLKGVDSALVRTDVVAYAAAQEIYPSVEGQISYITEMFPEEVHLLVGEDIDDIRALAGKTVDVGAPGSGTDITASILLSQLDIPVQTTAFGSYAALEKLRRGEISGAFFVGGKPMPLLADIASDSGLRLLSIPFVQYADSYRPGSISRRDYPNLIGGEADEDITTLAVRTALVTYDWRAGSSRYDVLANFSRRFFDGLGDLHQDAYHPKWREIDPTSSIQGWTRFEPAATWVRDNNSIARDIVSKGRSLIEQSATTSEAIGDEALLAPSLSLRFGPCSCEGVHADARPFPQRSGTGHSSRSGTGKSSR